MDGSVIFARWRQYASPYSTPQSASARYRCCPMLSRIEYIDCGHIRVLVVRHLGFQKFKFLSVVMVKMHNLSAILMAIHRTVAELWRFNGFYHATTRYMPSSCVCLSVCLSVTSRVGILLSWLDAGSRKQRHTIAQGL